jgi:hypothetical protein
MNLTPPCHASDIRSIKKMNKFSNGIFNDDRPPNRLLQKEQFTKEE